MQQTVTKQNVNGQGKEKGLVSGCDTSSPAFSATWDATKSAQEGLVDSSDDPSYQLSAASISLVELQFLSELTQVQKFSQPTRSATTAIRWGDAPDWAYYLDRAGSRSRHSPTSHDATNTTEAQRESSTVLSSEGVDKELYQICLCQGVPDRIHVWYQTAVVMDLELWQHQKETQRGSLSDNWDGKPSGGATQRDLHDAHKMLLVWTRRPLASECLALALCYKQEAKPLLQKQNVCNSTDLPEVEIISLLEEQLPHYKLRADTIYGYDHDDWLHTPLISPDANIDLTTEQIEETLKYFQFPVAFLPCSFCRGEGFSHAREARCLPEALLAQTPLF
ncbi:Trafficking kinesin-binding protein 1, partial [Ophiophagus hannah]